MKCSMVPPSLLSTCLDQVGPILLRAVQRTRGRWKIHDALDQIDLGHQQLWIAFDGQRIMGVVTTRVVPYPHRKMLEIVYCAGDSLKEWMSDMLDLLDHWREDNGCQGTELVGREGWTKLLEPFGFRKTYVVMEKSDG